MILASKENKKIQYSNRNINIKLWIMRKNYKVVKKKKEEKRKKPKKI